MVFIAVVLACGSRDRSLRDNEREGQQIALVSVLRANRHLYNRGLSPPQLGGPLSG